MRALKAVLLVAALFAARAYAQATDSTPAYAVATTRAHQDSTHAPQATAHPDSAHASAGAVRADSTRRVPPVDPRLGHWIAAARSADSATVMLLVAVPSGGRDSADVNTTEWETRVADTTRVGRLWIDRFARALGPPAKYAGDQICRPRSDPRQQDQLILGIHFDAHDIVPSALVMLKERCVQLREGTRLAGCVHGEPGTKSMIVLVREAFPHNPVVQSVTSPPLAAGQSPEPGVVVAPGQHDSVGAHVDHLPEVVTKVNPTYPPQAGRESGTVIVRALVGTDGTVTETKIANSIPRLDAAAVEAVRRWRFKPGTSKGQPVPAWVTVPVSFEPPPAPGSPAPPDTTSSPRVTPPAPPDTTRK